MREVVAIAQSTADARRVTPNHLGEVAPGIVPLRRSTVWVLGLLLVPAVDGGAGELDPLVVTIRARAYA